MSRQATITDTARTTLPQGRECGGPWTLLHIQVDKACELEIEWSVGDMLGQQATLTLSGGSRICLLADHVHATLVPRVADTTYRWALQPMAAPLPTANVYEQFVEVAGDGDQVLAVPTWAAHVQVHAADPTATLYLELLDSDGGLMVRLDGLSAMQEGLKVGGAATLLLAQTGGNTVQLRALWDLVL